MDIGNKLGKHQFLIFCRAYTMPIMKTVVSIARIYFILKLYIYIISFKKLVKPS